MQTKKEAHELQQAMTRGLRATRPNLRCPSGLQELNEILYRQWRRDCVVMYKIHQTYVRGDCAQNLDEFFRDCGCEATDAEAIEIEYINLPIL